jgi:hypothetical protein
MALTKRAGSHAPAWASFIGTSARLSPGLSISGERGRFLGGVTLEMYNEFHHQAPVIERPVAL